jgi:beta-glucanase (GH16 family)
VLTPSPRRAALVLVASASALGSFAVACSSPPAATNAGYDASSPAAAPSSPATGGGSSGPVSPPPPPSSSPAPSSADAGGGAGGGAGGDGQPDASLAGWTLTWSDEFDGPDGSAVDGTKWNQETGNSGFSSNQEREFYTPGTANAVVTGGALVITATDQGASQYKCQYGTCQYTSARFNTSGKFDQAYGRFEARIQIPTGKGLWPAFWTLGNNIGSAGWPQCGETDIMENVGNTPQTNHGSMHGPGYSGGHALTGTYSLPTGSLADDFHIYAIEWETNVVRFYVDDTLYETRTPADVPSGDQWVYDHPFFVILNVAVGGNFPGSPDGTTVFPQTMKVDYVRVYSR